MTERIAGKDYWKNCNLCKEEIPFGAVHYLCSVSTRRPQILMKLIYPDQWVISSLVMLPKFQGVAN